MPVYDGKLFVGLALYRETAEYLYIEHFYILQALRNHRYGRRTLDLLAECGKTLILEIDPSMDAIVCRRKMFYERCGFAENPFPHIHSPYHAENHGHALVVMTIFLPIPQEKYNDFYRYLTEKVLKDVF